MVPLLSLWLPIVLSALFVFVASSLIHMVLGYHNNEWKKLPAEERVMDALRGVTIPPGEYVMPHCGSHKATKDPAFIAKMKQGPVAFLTVMPNGPATMGRSLTLWFVYCLAVSLFAAYIASHALAPGARYLSVFRFAGATAFIGYAVALWQNTIWYKRALATTLKANIDGLVYAFLTAGTFGWLWPK